MARSTDPVIAYIEMLYANRDLISQAYHNAGVRETAENAKGVRALELARALRCFEGGLFRLTGKLRDHLDTVTSKLRAYDRLTRVSPQLERLRFLTTAMVEARHSGERQDMEQMAGDFADECFSIHDNVHANILKLSAQVQSGFATAQSVDEKIRQNQFYLRETAAIQDDLGSLVAFGLPADWQREELYEFARMYSAAVTEFLVGWQVQLAEIWKTIKAMLFKTRQVQVQNSNLARVLYLFQLHPRYEGPEIPVRELTEQEKIDVIGRILDANPEPNQPDDSLESLSGLSGLFGTRDHSFSARYDKYRDEAVPKFVEHYHQKLELMFDQIAVIVRVGNTGRVPAEAIIIDINAHGGWLNEKYVVGTPMGPRVPKQKIERFPNIPRFEPMRSAPIIGRHDVVIAEAPQRSQHAVIHCEDFRHGTDYTYNLVAWLDPRNGDTFELTVTVTAANMPGEMVRTFNIAKRIRDVEAAELVDYETFKLRPKSSFHDVLMSAVKTRNFELIEWDNRSID